MNTTTTNITRSFATETIGGTPLGGFTIERNDDDTAWTVSDGRWSEDREDAADALNTYAEMIEECAGDVEEYIAGRQEMDEDGTSRVEYATADDHRAEAAQARAEAAAL